MQNRGADVTLKMTVDDAAATNAQAMAIYQSDLHQRMIADAKKLTLAVRRRAWGEAGRWTMEYGARGEKIGSM